MKPIVVLVLISGMYLLAAKAAFPEGGAPPAGAAARLDAALGRLGSDRNRPACTPKPTSISAAPLPTPRDKTLTIVNHSGIQAAVYLDEYPGATQRLLGLVDSYSRRVFTGIPPRGRWYVTIEPRAPGRAVKSFSFTLYVKEAQYKYSHEIWDDDFR